MRIQFASDLHLESRPQETFERFLEPSVAPVLALLGDIAPLDHPNLPKFLEWCSERWETVLYVPGATEIGQEISLLAEQIHRMRAVCSPYSNIHVLYREAFFSSDGFIVLGCILWGCLAEQPAAYREFHRADVRWIQQFLRSYTQPFLILSHFGPVPWVQDERRLYEPADVPSVPEMELLLRKPIVAWIFGHFHGLVETHKIWNTPTGEAREITLVCNGLGAERFPQKLYRRDAVLRLDAAIFAAHR
jgi:hypothetical protein